MFAQGARYNPASSAVQHYHHPAINDQRQNLNIVLLQLNAHAVMLLQQGLAHNAEAAMLLFNTGLRWLQLDEMACGEVIPKGVPSNCQVSMQRVRLDENQDDDVQNHFSLFDRAALITVNEDKSMPIIINRDQMAAVFFYNIGLACTLMGLRRSENRQRFLLEAIGNYKAAAAILPWKSNTLANDKLLILSIINNQGYIFTLLLETNKANECLMLLEARLSEADCLNEADDVMIQFHLSVAIRSKGMGLFAAAPAA